ncbi:hypothetical protein EDB81DRAFT_752285 [Dactylonectria macrodidyma]|uniref:Uncharacterized protein n=1 Tax=Dactylonectria macrodidyma TaxID=307937 RepID=A0A9P9JPA5_9HYPO|nr:hypothetical protein EDB81DRAFT_752285 [Dactylonectria macrodidyma]
MHHCCSRGAFACWHLNADVIHQGCARLIRIGQEKSVEWRLLKVRDSYHDNIERICVTKWAVQLSAEIALPGWVTDFLRETCNYETIKTYWHPSFNRAAWNIVRDADGPDIDYYSEKTIRIGHICSLVAKMVMCLTGPSQADTDTLKRRANYWRKSGDTLAVACVRAGTCEDMTIKRLEILLEKAEFVIYKEFMHAIVEEMKLEEFIVKSELDDDEDDNEDTESGHRDVFGDPGEEETDEESTNTEMQLPTPKRRKLHKSLIPADTVDIYTSQPDSSRRKMS